MDKSKRILIQAWINFDKHAQTYREYQTVIDHYKNLDIILAGIHALAEKEINQENIDNGNWFSRLLRKIDLVLNKLDDLLNRDFYVASSNSSKEAQKITTDNSKTIETYSSYYSDLLDED